MLKRNNFIALICFTLTFTLYSQDADNDGVLDGVDTCINTVDVNNLDFDGDGIGDVCDLDDDNDGILDIFECEVPIINSSFESNATNADNWLIDAPAGSGVESPPSSPGNFPYTPEGNNYLYLEHFIGFTPAVATTNIPLATYEETNYILSFYIGDGIGTALNQEDDISLIQMGYGNDAASFQPIPGADITIDGITQTAEGWNRFEIPFFINDPSPALNEGILIRITYTHNGFGLIRASYDNFELKIDTDGDGNPNCTDLNSDDDPNGCFDVAEAGHIDNGTGQLQGTSIDPTNGLVSGFTTGYTGNKIEVIQASLNTCAPFYNDNDQDTVLDIIDLDDDNDGILDIYDCQIPILNYSFEDSAPGAFPQEGWDFTPLTGDAASVAIPNSTDDYFYAPDGNQYGFINGSGIISQRQTSGSFELGTYILTLDIGDGIDYFTNNFRNDGTSLIEIGYLDGGGNFVPVNSLTVTGDETPNGVWTSFSFPTLINPGNPALGEGIRIQITHTQNDAINQRRGDYDNITLTRDRDNDGIIDCYDTDSDEDGCFDVTEVGNLNNGSGQLQGTGIDLVNGLVTGFTTGYTGLRAAYFDDSIIACDAPTDTDGDLVTDGDQFYLLPSGFPAYDEFDEDNDNDGILDVDEGCMLTSVGFAADASSFEFPGNNNIYYPTLGLDQIFASGAGPFGNGVLDFWNSSNPNGTGAHLVNASQYIDPGTGNPYAANYATDGALLFDNLDFVGAQNYSYDQFAFIDGNATLTQTQSFIPIEEGSYIITIAVGDGLDYEDGYRNDGISFIEAGYGPSAAYTSLGNITVNPEDTPNGTWTDFTFSITIPAGSPAIGQELLMRITHTENVAANQLSGNYDHIRIRMDHDNDGIPDCLDEDSDGDGCPDATEAGYTNDDNDNFVGNGTPVVDGNGIVIGTDGYNPPINAGVPIITPAEPVIISVGLTDPTTVCEGQDAVFTVTAARAGANPNMEYEWSVSTDAGTTWTLVEDYSIGTNTLTVASVSAAQNNHQYRIWVRGDDYLCFEESIATLQVTPGPTTPTLTSSTAICEGDNAIFTITGDPNDTVNYSLDGGATILSSTLNSTTGISSIAVTAPTTDITLEIVSIEDSLNSCVVTLPTPISQTVTLNALPTAPINPINESVCEGNPNIPISVELDPLGAGDTINWYDVPTGGTSLDTGLTYTSVETAPSTYTYYAESENLASGCLSTTRTAVTYTINAAVIADIIADQNECDSFTLPNLTAGNNYYTGTGGSGTALNAGDIITASQTIYIYAESNTAPNCTDESSFNVNINTTPVLLPLSNTCSTDLATYEVVFQAFTGTLTTTAGTVVGNDTVTDIPAGTDITVTATNNGCTSTLVITAPNCNCPTLDAPFNSVDGSSCEGQPTASLSVDLPATGGDIINWYDSPAGGTIIATGNTFTPIETIAGVYTYYAETFDTVTACASIRTAVILTITNTPIAEIMANPAPSCDSYTLPPLTPGNSYYTGPSGTGSLLNEGEIITGSQTIYIFAESGTIPNCTDESSFDVVINNTPTPTIISNFCSTDLLTYEITLQADTGVLTTTAGTVVGNDRIIDIPAGTDITISVANNGCVATLPVTAPDCTCSSIPPPTNPINGINCFGEPTASLSVDATSSTQIVNWYETDLDIIPIATGDTFTPMETAVGQYTYYAEILDPLTLCSSDKISVTLTIDEIPAIINVQDVESCEFYILPQLGQDLRYFNAPNGSGTELIEGQQILTSQTVYVYGESPSNSSCASETFFDITILQEPIIDMPASLSLCSEETGNTEVTFLGTDLGPGYRYDWTPNNDTDGNGIEEAIFEITEAGTYTLQIYQIGTNGFECGGLTTYSTVVEETLRPTTIAVEVISEGYELNSGNRVRLIVNENPLLFDQFEYSITSPEGPYQSNNIFENVEGGLYTGYVRSTSACENFLASEPFLIVNYPTFFTPNGDGFNETWKPLGLENLNITSDVDVHIFDKYGKLLTKLNPLGPGWDGTYNNEIMVSSDYWFKVNFINELTNEPVEFSGHFSLKR